MSLSRQNLSIIIVTLKSEDVIYDCIESIDRDIPIIVVENSNNYDFKKKLESKYNNVKCIVTNKNLGMGSANNIGIRFASTDYVYILNPDTILEKNTLKNLILASKTILDFSIISPIQSDNKFPNWKNKNIKNINFSKPFLVDSVDGYSMLLNKNKFNNEYFDENFFLYLENDDLCMRVEKNKGSIFIIPDSIINHKGGMAVNLKHKTEIELSRNWHWMWSKFYFNKKHYGFLNALLKSFVNFITALLKYLFYLLIKNNFKKNIYFCRISGFFNSLIGKSSWYRPNLDD